MLTRSEVEVLMTYCIGMQKTHPASVIYPKLQEALRELIALKEPDSAQALTMYPSHLLFVGLMTSATQEVQAEDYARRPLGILVAPRNVWCNRDAVRFPKPTSDWGRITHVGFYGLEADGPLLEVANLDIPKTIRKDDDGISFLPQHLYLPE